MNRKIFHSLMYMKFLGQTGIILPKPGIYFLIFEVICRRVILSKNFLVLQITEIQPGNHKKNLKNIKKSDIFEINENIIFADGESVWD